LILLIDAFYYNHLTIVDYFAENVQRQDSIALDAIEAKWNERILEFGNLRLIELNKEKLNK
jgi:hypothetical protein